MQNQSLDKIVFLNGCSSKLWANFAELRQCKQFEMILKLKTGEEKVLVGVLKASRYFGTLLLPYLCDDDNPVAFFVRNPLATLDLDQFENADPGIVVLYELALSLDPHRLIKRFSKNNLNLNDFVSEKNKKVFDTVVMPFVWQKFAEIEQKMNEMGIPLYEARSWPKLYPDNAIERIKELAETKLYFDKGEDSTTYVLKAWVGKTPLHLQDSSNRLLSIDPCYLMHQNQLIRFDETVNGKMIKPFLEKSELFIPSHMERLYFERFIKKIANTSNIEAKGFDMSDLEVQPTAQLHIEQSWDGIFGMVLKFDYAEKVFLCDQTDMVVTLLEISDAGFIFKRIKRQLTWEKQLVDALKAKGFVKAGSFFMAPQGGSTIENFLYFLSDYTHGLEAEGFRFIQAKEMNYLLQKPELKIIKENANDWFDINIILHIGDVQLPFVMLRNHLLDKVPFYLFEDGTRFLVPEVWFERYTPLFIHAKKHGTKLRFAHHHLPLVSQLLPELNLITLTPPRPAVKLELPHIENASLRPYQQHGFYWLSNHLQQQTGAILADDMGLGKTLQMIALLVAFFSTNISKSTKSKVRIPAPLPVESEGQLDIFTEASSNLEQLKADDNLHLPALVVMPTSLIHNWLNELKRFAPQLRIHVYTGVKRNLTKRLIANNDVILTTYGIMRNEIDRLSRHVFSIVILDESQQIKSPTSKTAQAAFMLNATHRFALTGTPVENRLSDLWSQMQFVNPSLLGDLNTFNRYYAVPIAKEIESVRRTQLLSIIQPYILRRTKMQVAPELPPITETLVYCDMDEMQELLYVKERARMRNSILEKISSETSPLDNSFLYLAALMKLRQLANHPKMLFPDETAGSGKFREVLDYLETVLDEQHKVLIFSSFVTQLELLEVELQQRNIVYSKLIGATRDREEVIKNFRKNKENQVFLISLKAGGVGLNLAEADYVFILDPWWNPAAESQAVGRSHRIGQNKNVFVYRFITRNSIEEKIRKLQESKRQLAEMTIVEESFYAALSQKEKIGLLE